MWRMDIRNCRESKEGQPLWKKKRSLGAIQLPCIEKGDPVDRPALGKVGGTYDECSYGDDAGESLLGLSGYMVTWECSFLISLVPCVFETFSGWFGKPGSVTVKSSDYICK